MNTASRMESYGVPGYIHCSQETADALSAQSKGHWLQCRDDTIVPKGKDTMQTYFVYVEKASSSNTETSTIVSTFPAVQEHMQVTDGNDAVSRDENLPAINHFSPLSECGYFKQLYPNPDLCCFDSGSANGPEYNV